jgi:phage baseplate assembly protein W
MAIPDDTNIYGKVLPKKSEKEITLKDALVKGFKYPFKETNNNGYFSKSTGLSLVKSMVKSFIRTNRGERFMLPDYGADLQKYLMEPLDQETFKLIKDEIESSVRKYLSILQLNKLQIFENRDSSLVVKLFVGLKDSNSTNFNVEVRI